MEDKLVNYDVNHESIVSSESNQYLNQSDHYLQYPYRFVIVILYLMSCLAISIMQNTYAPQASYLTCIYDISNIEVSSTSFIHLALHAPVSFPANYIVDKYGVRVGITIGAILNIMGSWVRCFVNTSFWFVLLGQVFLGCANPFIINCLNKVSANWFYPEQRPLITSILSFFSTITGLGGLLIPGIWFSNYTQCLPNNPSEISEGKDLTFSLTMWEAIIISILQLPNVFLFRDKPPTPPCFTSGVEKEDFKVALRVLCKKRDYFFLGISFAFYYGSFTILAIILSFLIKPFGYTDTLDTSIIAMTPAITGLMGCILGSLYLKKTNKYKFYILLGEVASFIFLLLFMACLNLGLPLMIISVGVVGFFIVPLIPGMLEFACEISFPIGEGTSTGFIYACAHIFGGTVGVFVQWLANGKEKKNSYYAILFILSLFLIGFILSYMMKEDLRRLKSEQEKKVKKQDDSIMDQSQSEDVQLKDREFQQSLAKIE